MLELIIGIVKLWRHFLHADELMRKKPISKTKKSMDGF
jgi:hypothetical protein